MEGFLHERPLKNFSQKLLDQRTFQKNALATLEELVLKQEHDKISNMTQYLDLCDQSLWIVVINCNDAQTLDILIQSGMPYDWDGIDAPLILAARSSELAFFKHLEKKIKCLKDHQYEPFYAAITYKNFQVVEHFSKSRKMMPLEIIFKAFDLALAAESDFMCKSVLSGKNLDVQTKEILLQKVFDLDLNLPQTVNMLL
jgi:hypothetical protein